MNKLLLRGGREMLTVSLHLDVVVKMVGKYGHFA